QTVNTIVGRRAAIGSRRILKQPRRAGGPARRGFFQVASSPGWSRLPAVWMWNSITLDNRPCHRWDPEAVGSSTQTCASPSCCRYRATTKSASRAARTIQMLTRMTNTPASRVAVKQLGGAALYGRNEGLGTLAGGRTTRPVALGIADRAFAK